MNKEQDTINRILKVLPRSPLHSNNFFESDAELINYNGKKILFSIDDFSQEDYFRDDKPYNLGWNVAVGTISDILASGGKPFLYAHSMTIPQEKWTTEYIDNFSEGIADVLKTYSAGFIGGDIGSAEKWQYTGVVLGECITPLSRIGAKNGHVIYMTGKVGAGNLEAATKLYSKHKLLKPLINKFRLKLPIRIKESELINQYATACIDSSDGILNALNTLTDLNKLGFNLEDIPYIKEGEIACKVLSKPKLLLFMGECGEYELVFTLKKEDEAAFIDKSKEQKLQFHKLGEVCDSTCKKLNIGNKTINLNSFNISARDYENIEDYLNALIEFAGNK